MKFAAAAAVAVLAVVVGAWAFAPKPTTPAGPPPSLATATPTSTPAPTPTPGPTPVALSNASSTMVSGTYVTDDPFQLPGVEFTLDTDWIFDVQHELTTFMHQVNTAGGSSAYLSFEVPTVIYADPCATGKTPASPPVGDSIDDFIAALGEWPHFTVGPVTDTTIDGRPAREFDLSSDIPFDGTGCNLGSDPLIPLWDEADTQGEVAGQHLILVDVDGTRFLINVLYTGPEADTEATVQAVIDSIKLP